MVLFKVINTDDKKDLDNLYKNSAFTFEGLDIREDNINEFLNAMVEEKVMNKDIEAVVYVTKGRLMNKEYSLQTDNKYPDELNIVSINLDQFTDIGKLEIVKMKVGARWFDDIVDNNNHREA